MKRKERADNLQTEVSALDYGGTAEFEIVGNTPAVLADEK